MTVARKKAAHAKPDAGKAILPALRSAYKAGVVTVPETRSTSASGPTSMEPMVQVRVGTWDEFGAAE